MIFESEPFDEELTYVLKKGRQGMVQSSVIDTKISLKLSFRLVRNLSKEGLPTSGNDTGNWNISKVNRSNTMSCFLIFIRRTS